MIKLFILSPESTEASEKAGKAGDNAVFVVIKMLRSLGFDIIGNEVSILPKGQPLSLKRRAEAIKKHRSADLTLVMGNDTLRSIKSWFPANETLTAPQPFFYINEPGRIEIELAVKLKDAYSPAEEIGGFNPETKLIGF